jgi:hypothetical protein
MSRTEEQMEEELKGMAAPIEGEPMEDGEMPMEGEGSSTVDAMTMVSNFNQMDENEQMAITPLFQQPVRTAMEALFGAQVISDFVSEAGIGEGEEAPMEPEVPATPPAAPTPEGMMAPEATTMAKGGMLNTQMQDMIRQGMSPEQIRNKMR